MALVFSQMQAQFEEMKKAAIESLRAIFPIDGKLRSVEMEKAWVDDTLDSTDYGSQQKAKSSESTWGVPVYAHLKLVDKRNGKTIDENPKVKLFTLPKPTQRHSFIVGGNEYQVQNQLRLRPGVYTIRKQNGELKTQINLSKGKNFDLNFDEGKGVFNIQKIGGGQANIPLYPILIYLGVSKGDIARAWGDKLAASNEAFADPKAVDRLEAALRLPKNQSAKDYLETTQISPDTTKAALGKSFERVDGPLLLASSKKLLHVHMGKEEPTDRDSLEYKELHGIGDYVRERLEKNKNTLAYRIKRSVDNLKRDKITQLVSQGAFTSTIESFFIQDDKSSTPEQTNPLEMLSGTQKVTFMGAGGIGSTHAITNEMRQIHPSHLGFIDPTHTPSSDRIGVNLHLPLGAVKDGKELKSRVVDSKGREFLLSPVEMKEKKIALPDEKGATVRVMHRGQIVEVPRTEVDYYIPSAANLFSYSANLVPFLPSAQGNRVQMASKMLEQAISLKHREAPLVQSLHPDGKSFEDVVGETASIRSPVDGKVARVSEDKITINSTAGKTVEINLYNNFALNRKSFIHHYPNVKAGDNVKKDQLLADSNYTKEGTLALGANMKTGYLSFRGLNFDDGIVISQAASQRLTSEHIYTKDLPIFANTITGLEVFRNYYPTSLSPKNLAKLDKDGVIKKGEKIAHGEAYTVALQKRAASAEIALVSKVLSDRPKDISMYWTLEDTGTVIDVIKTSKKITVVIKTEEAAKIGDKLSNRHGGKGVVTGIIPDHEMPKTKDGPIEVLMSPMGIISRINVSQTYESAIGKAVSKTGAKPYVVNNFDGSNYLQKVKEHLAKTGVDDKEEVFDGETGKSLGQVHVGMPHILKLFKQSQGNFSVRQGGAGAGYDANMQPLKAGGEEGSKSMDVLTMYSMLSHGARANLREMASVKSSKNDEFWKALKAGEQLPTPQTSFAYNKFLGYLKGAGVDVRKQGTQLMLAPFTDAQVKEVSKAEITKPLFFRAKDMSPIKGGFFDATKLGGLKGDKWGHIVLAEPVVNPPFESAVRKLTGLGKKFDEVMSGTMHLDEKGVLNKDGKGVTGGAAIEQLLKKIDVDKELEDALKKATRAKTSQLDDLNKRIRYLQALKNLGLRPEEAYIRKYLPVVPPSLRPVYPLPDGNITSGHANYIYQSAGIVNTLMKFPVMDLLHEKDKAGIREALYENVKGVSGTTDLNIKGKDRAGFISEIKGGTGGQPKEGFFISKLLSKRQDYVGRGTIIPEPSLGIDELAMPEAMAWKLFEPFVIRELKNHGKTPVQALEEIKGKTALASRALEIVMAQRHVLLNRAPSLHKFSIMAFKPIITDGKSIKIQPLVNKGFGADYDGDEQLTTVWIFVPSSGTPLLSETVLASRVEDPEMTARFKEVVGIKNESGEFYAVNLEDFPHDDLLGSKEGEKGRIDFYKAREGLRVLSYDAETGSMAWKAVFGWSKHYAREIEVVTLRSGRQIVTDDDPRAVFGIAAGSLSPKRFRPKDAVEQNVLVPLMVRGEGCLDSGRKTVHAGIALDSDFGHFIGSMVANGWVEKCHGTPTGKVWVACVDKACGNKFLDIGQRVFEFPGARYAQERGYSAENSYGKSTKWGFMSDKASMVLAPLIGHGAREKHLPPFFLIANREFRNGLFAGLMDHGGSVSVSRAVGKKPQLMANYSTASIRLAQEVQWLAKSIGIRSRITVSKTPAGEPFWYVSFSNMDIKSWGGEGMVNEKKLASLNDSEVVCSEFSPAAAKSDVVPIPFETAKAIQKIMGCPRNAPDEHKTTYSMIHKAGQCGHITRISAIKLLERLGASALCDVPYLDSWKKIVENTDVTWDLVESFEKTGIKEDGYDLTVPGHETFTNIEGVVLSNTMTVHAPISDLANKEAAKMLPSRNLFQPGSGNLMLAPSQEAQLGIYYLSQSEDGRKKLHSILGEKFPVTKTLDKKSTQELLKKVAHDSPESYGNIVRDLKDLGEKELYLRGSTIGVADIVDFSRESKTIVAGAKRQMEVSKDTAATNKNIQDSVDAFLKSKLEGKGNPFYDQISSGAKGSSSQLRSILVSPLFMSDSKGRVVKLPISKSYAAGLTATDYWTAAYGVRKGLMDTAVSTSLPGAFSKDIMATVVNNVVSMNDCGTQDGVDLPVSSNDCLERFLAVDQHGMARNTLVDRHVLDKMHGEKVATLKVRSPLKCKAKHGVCAHCYGLDEHGHIPEIGENVGAKSGQTISEPLVQMLMSSKHTGGVAGTGTNAGGYQRITQLLSLPKVLTGSATLAPVAGRVSKITKGVAGGYDVYIGDRKAHIAQGNTPLVGVGSEVAQGDALSTGPSKPQDLVSLKGMSHAQNYLTDELQRTYKEQGVGVNRKTFETVVRSLTDTTQVTNNPKHMDFLPGDVVPLSVVNHYNSNLVQEVSIEEAEGDVLAEGHGPLKVGHTLTSQDISALRSAGIHKVKVKMDAIQHRPFVKGMSSIPLLRQDWMAGLGYRNLSKIITEGASQGWKTDTESYHPIPAIAHGTTFGTGKDGRY